jgi:hypothetical protein
MGRIARLGLAVVAALLAATEFASCSKAGGAAAEHPRVLVITPSEAQAGPEFRAAEALVRAYESKGEKGKVTRVELPDKPAKGGGMEATIAAFIAEAAGDLRVKAIVAIPALPGSSEGFRLAKEARAGGGKPGLLCLAGESSEDELSIEASADLVVDLDRVYRAYLVPWAAKKMGAKALVAVFARGEEADPRFAREREIMSAASADLGLKYLAAEVPAGVDAAAYARAMTGAWFRDFGRDTALHCSDPVLAAPLVSGAIAGGGIIVDAGGGATRAAYAAALGLDLSPAKGDARKERALVEAAAVALGLRGRLGLWEADYGRECALGLAEYALRAVSGAAKKDELKDFAAALGAGSPDAAWLVDYDVDPETGVRSANRILLRQDVYVLGSGYLQSALQAVPAKYLSIRAPGG